MKIKFLTIMAAVAMFSCGEVADNAENAAKTGAEKTESIIDEAKTKINETVTTAVDSAKVIATEKGDEIIEGAKAKGTDLIEKVTK